MSVPTVFLAVLLVNKYRYQFEVIGNGIYLYSGSNFTVETLKQI